MLDMVKRKPVTVTGDHIIVPLDQLERVKALFEDNGIVFWHGDDVISINGGPENIFVYFGRSVDSIRVQQLLDDAT